MLKAQLRKMIDGLLLKKQKRGTCRWFAFPCRWQSGEVASFFRRIRESGEESDNHTTLKVVL